MRIGSAAAASVTGLSRRARASMVVRSFAIQGSWNYRTLIGNGFAFTILPALREIFHLRPDDYRSAVERHSRVFNSHPYFAGIALGAVARLEAEGTDPVVIDRFKTAVRGSLGSLGDRLIWAAWRPVCVLLALIVLAAGSPWWLAVAAFLAVYNAGHIAIRLWGFRLGLRYGLGVAEQLRRYHVSDLQRGMASTGAFLLGFLIPLTAVGGLVSARLPPGFTLAAVAAAALGLRFGNGIRPAVALALAGFTLLGLVYEVVS